MIGCGGTAGGHGRVDAGGDIRRTTGSESDFVAGERIAAEIIAIQ